MSAAIKRLSTIIHPRSTSSSSGTAAEAEKQPTIDAAAPAEPVPATGGSTEAAAEAKPAAAEQESTEKPSAPEVANGTDGTTKETTDAQPETTQEASEKKEDSPTVLTKKEESAHRRDPREIGRETIRRFSTILKQGRHNPFQSNGKPKEAVPPVPTQKDGETASADAQPAKAESDAAAAAAEAPAATTDDVTAAPEAKETAPEATAEKSKPAKPAKAKKDSKQPDAKAPKPSRRGSSFFAAAREAVRVQPRKTDKDAAKKKTATKTEKVAVPKVVKKGAAKGKRVVVITGASTGVGLEFAKEYAFQQDTFVIALAPSIDKSAEVKTLVNDSAKNGHNVRAIRLDISNNRSISTAVKEIVELTDGRIDLLINTGAAPGNQTLRMAELKGSELESELQQGLIGPIAFTNALLPYLRPFPTPEPAKEAPEPAQDGENAKPEETAAEPKPEEAKDAEAAQPSSDKPEEAAEEKAAAPEAKEEKSQEPATQAGDLTTVEPVAETEPAGPAPQPSAEPDVKEDAAAAQESTEAKEEPAVAAEEPAPPAKTLFPAHPFVVFLTPSEPIHNSNGVVPSGTFAVAPKTLSNISQGALQIAIAKYAMSLSGSVGVVGIERSGLGVYDTVSDAESVKGVINLIPDLTIGQTGQLLKAA